MHVLGYDRVTDKDSVMGSGLPLGPGDLEGLHTLYPKANCHEYCTGSLDWPPARLVPLTASIGRTSCHQRAQSTDLPVIAAS